MDKTIMRSLKRLCCAAAIAGAMAAMQVPAEAQRANANVAAGAKADAVAQTTIHKTKSVSPRKRSRCHG